LFTIGKFNSIPQRSLARIPPVFVNMGNPKKRTLTPPSPKKAKKKPQQDNRPSTSRSLPTTHSDQATPTYSRVGQTSTAPPPATPSTSADNTSSTSAFAHPNPFSVLPVQPNNSGEQEPHKEPRPPPIFINNVCDFMKFLKDLKDELGSDNFTCKSRMSDVKLSTFSSQGYRSAISYLRRNNANFHTYQLREDRAFRVVLRHLHPTTPTDAIKEELEALGHEVRTVTNAISSRTKEALPLFFVELNPNPTNNSIYNLKHLLNTVVKVEEPHPRTDIAQCIRCQAYGHTKSYCNHAPKCVKCAEDHLTKDCIKSRETPARCVLCGGAHPANYKGCSIYTELKKRTQRKDANSEARPSFNPSGHFPPLSTPGQENRQATCSSATTPPEDKPTYASVAGHRRPSVQVSNNYIPPPNQSFDITSQLNIFISKMETLITPLISLLTTIVSVLLPTQSTPKP